jgi:hypothetical protein
MACSPQLSVRSVDQSHIRAGAAAQPMGNVITMEHMIPLPIEKLPEGVYPATSDEVQQGC